MKMTQCVVPCVGNVWKQECSGLRLNGLIMGPGFPQHRMLLCGASSASSFHCPGSEDKGAIDTESKWQPGRVGLFYVTWRVQAGSPQGGQTVVPPWLFGQHDTSPCPHTSPGCLRIKASDEIGRLVSSHQARWLLDLPRHTSQESSSAGERSPAEHNRYPTSYK